MRDDTVSDDVITLGELIAGVVDADLRFRRLRLETRRKAGIDRWPLQVSRPRAQTLADTQAASEPRRVLRWRA